MGLFNCLRNKKAQIVLPAILLIPTILLVIYLLFETAKLSRFKIRSQFALDSAAFIELTSYSNFLNAVAYVNGAFPFRVFRENMRDTVQKGNPEAEGPDTITYYDLFYQAGAFPAMGEGNLNANPKESAGRWELKYKEAPSDNSDDITLGRGRPKNWNTDNPKASESTEYGLNSRDLVENYDYFFLMKDEESGSSQGGNNNDNEEETGIMAPITLYIAVYKMFENIYESQKKVYERLTDGGEFFRKSFYYNSSSCKLSQCGKEGVKAFKDYSLELESVRLDKMAWYYKAKDLSSGYTSGVEKLLFETSNEKYKKFMPLYQFSYLTKNTRNKVKKMYTGLDIREPIIPPDNYFRVNVKRYAQKLHVKAAIQCTNESNNCVWPNPTPKYQVRLFP